MPLVNKFSQTIPSLEPQCYEWRHSSSGSGWERPALAGETMWAHRPKECHQMFLMATLTLFSHISLSEVHSTTRHTWLQLRSENPDIGVTTRKTDEGKVYMRPQIFRDDTEADTWCEETFIVEALKQEIGLDALKKKVISRKAQAPLQPVLLWLVAISDGDDMVQRIELMLNMEHQITDGIGIKIVLSKLLSLLATNISTPGTSNQIRIKWDKSPKVPSTPWIRLLNDDQVLSGPQYERAVVWNREVLLDKMSQNPGLPLRPKPSLASQNHHFTTLTRSQTTKILSAIKPLFGQEATITHLGHASMVLALLRHARLCPKDLYLYSPCWLNGRRYLLYPGSNLQLLPPIKSYIPICQSFAPIIFPNIHELALSLEASKDEIREKLVKACHIATEQYVILKTRKSVMPESIALMEYLGSQMSQAATVTTPPISSQGNLQTRPLAAEPFFLSDGLIENHIDHQYRDAFVVDDVQFAANAEGPNLIVRMYSWRGLLRVSGEWRGCDYEQGFVKAFLEDVVGIMGAIVGEDGK
ncbi:hypothetical protein BGZ60DRAFT_523985 [Tricladium varicosporioides]|nr:hypothetical protein BGZ60DRAFT_523985 [Hymenoscyphus varicosporioides]